VSRHRRQQLKRARRWVIEVRDSVFGWRASYWRRLCRDRKVMARGVEMFAATHFEKLERRIP